MVLTQDYNVGQKPTQWKYGTVMHVYFALCCPLSEGFLGLHWGHPSTEGEEVDHFPCRVALQPAPSALLFQS